MTSISTIIDCDLLRFMYLTDSTGYLPELAHYIEKIIEGYNQEFGSWREQLEKKTPFPGATSNDQEEWDAWGASDGQFLTRDFPRRLRYDFVITTYTVWFGKLDLLCSLAAKKLHLEYVRVLRKELENAQIFLEKYVKLKPLAEVHWTEFTLVRDLRNELIHQNGFISDDLRKRLEQRENDWANVVTKKEAVGEFLSYGPNGQVTVHASYCQLILGHKESFFRAIYEID